MIMGILKLVLRFLWFLEDLVDFIFEKLAPEKAYLADRFYPSAYFEELYYLRKLRKQ